MASATGPLTPAELGPQLARVYRVVGPLYRRVLRRVEADESVMEMSVGVRAVLDELTMSAQATVPQLARRLDLSRQFVQRSVNDARSSGWVQTRDNPAHRRSVLVDVTGPGREVIERVHQREHALMGKVGGDITEQDIETTLRVLREMHRAVELVDTGTDQEQRRPGESQFATEPV